MINVSCGAHSLAEKAQEPRMVANQLHAKLDLYCQTKLALVSQHNDIFLNNSSNLLDLIQIFIFSISQYCFFLTFKMYKSQQKKKIYTLKLQLLNYTDKRVLISTAKKVNFFLKKAGYACS